MLIRLMCLFLGSFAIHTANADVVISKTARLSLENMSTLSDQFKIASEWRDEHYIGVLKQFGFEEDFVISCPKGAPLEDGSGCIIGLGLSTQAFGLSIQKPLEFFHAETQLTAMNEKLAAFDPNESDDHYHVGNPFTKSPSDDDTTHWYCYSEGQAGAKTWVCDVYFMERITR